VPPAATPPDVCTLDASIAQQRAQLEQERKRLFARRCSREAARSAALVATRSDATEIGAAAPAGFAEQNGAAAAVGLAAGAGEVPTAPESGSPAVGLVDAGSEDGDARSHPPASPAPPSVSSRMRLPPQASSPGAHQPLARSRLSLPRLGLGIRRASLPMPEHRGGGGLSQEAVAEALGVD